MLKRSRIKEKRSIGTLLAALIVFNVIGFNLAKAEEVTIKYGRTVRAYFDDRYYYCLAVCGSRDYIKIGCKTDYLIRLDNLSDDREDDVNSYVNAIDNSNSHYYFAKGYIGVEGVTLAVTILTAGIGALVAAPVSLVAVLVGIGFIGTASEACLGINQVIDGRTDLDKATYMYDLIKNYGVRIQ